MGSAEHKLALTTAGNSVSGSHAGWAYKGDIKGAVDGSRVDFRSSMPCEGTHLTYRFTGTVTGDQMSGEVGLGEYGKARWRARRQTAKA